MREVPGNGSCTAAHETVYSDEDLRPWSLAKVESQAAIQRHYATYISREHRMADRLRRLEHVPIPGNFDFENLTGLLNEARQKLARVRPRDLGQAARIPGVTPADIQVLWIQLEKRRRTQT